MKRIAFLILLFLSSCGSNGSGLQDAEAANQPQILKEVLVVVLRDEITYQQQIDIFNYGVSRTSEVKATVKVMRTVITPDVLQKNRLGEYVTRGNDWFKWARKNNINAHGYHVHFLLPTVVDANGVHYQGGASGAICTTTRNPTRKYSYSIVRLFNDAGEDRFEGSVVDVLHEILHVLGANHIDEKQNVMRSYYNPGPQPILSLTKRQVEYCRQGKSPKGN